MSWINWLFIVSAVVVVGFAVYGCVRGFLRVIYGLAKWIIAAALVVWLTPILTAGLINHTGIHDAIARKTEIRLEQRLEALEENAESRFDDTQLPEADTESLESETADADPTGDSAEASASLREAGIALPKAITAKIPALLGETLLNSDICQTVSNEIADLAVKGIVGLVIMLLGIIVLFVIDRLLKLVDKIPVVGKANRVIGLFAGLAEGMIILWTFLAFVAMEVGTGFGQFFYSLISQCPPLNFVYEKNLILTLVMAFF